MAVFWGIDFIGHDRSTILLRWFVSGFPLHFHLEPCSSASALTELKQKLSELLHILIVAITLIVVAVPEGT